MSLQTATLGWGIVNRSNNLYFNLNYIGKIYIGIDLSIFNQSISKTSYMKLKVASDKENMKRTVYKNANDEEEVFSVMTVGNHVHRIRYTNLISLIPQDLIYQVGKKRFLTNNRIDGYMMAIKNTNEIYLKEDKLVDAIDINSESLGVVKKSLTKAEAQANSKAWMQVYNTRDKYATEMYNKGQAEIDKLEAAYKQLEYKENQLLVDKERLTQIIGKYKKELDNSKDYISKADSTFKEAKQNYNKLIKENESKIDKLIRLGKIRQEKGLIVLNEGSDNTHTTEKIKSVSVYKEEPYTIEIPDEDFIEAKELVDKLYAPGNYYIALAKKYGEMKVEFKKLEQVVSDYMGTPEYKDSLKQFDDIQRELESVKKQKEKIKIQLYGK